MKNVQGHLLRPVVAMSFWLACLCTLSSCIKEGGNPFPAIKSTVTLTMKVPTLAESRALTEDQENKVADIWVLLFKDGKFVEKCEGKNIQDVGTNNTDNDTKKFEVEFPIGTFDMIFVANCGTMLSSAGITKNDTRAQAAEKLIASVGSSWTYAWPYQTANFEPFPMCGELAGVTISKEMGQLTKMVYLIRAIARIDVKFSDQIPIDYYIRSIRLYNAYTNAQVIPDVNSVSIDAQGDLQVLAPSIPQSPVKKPTYTPFLYLFPDPGTPTPPGTPNYELGRSVTATVYTFEALKGTFAGWETNTCIVIGLSKRGDGATRSNLNDVEEWFYRIDFLADQKYHDDDDYLPLLRNHMYEITLQNINHLGFIDHEQAFRSEIYTIDYSIADLEYVHIDTEAGKNRYELYIWDGTYIEMKANTTYDYLMIMTTHPEGWTWAISDNATTINTPPNIDQLLEIEIFDGSPDPYEFSYVLIRTARQATQSLYYIHVTAGNMTNVIKLKIGEIQEYD